MSSRSWTKIRFIHPDKLRNRRINRKPDERSQANFAAFLGIDRRKYIEVERSGGPITKVVYSKLEKLFDYPGDEVWLTPEQTASRLFDEAEQLAAQLDPMPLEEWPDSDRKTWEGRVGQGVEAAVDCPHVLVGHRRMAVRLFTAYWDKGQVDKCRDLSERMMEALEAVGDRIGQAEWLHEQAVHDNHSGDLDRAATACRMGLALLGQSASLLRGHLLHRRGRIEQDRGDLKEARRWLQQSLAAKEQLPLRDDDELASTRSVLAVVDELEGKLGEAVEEQKRCLALAGKPDCRRPIRLRLARAKLKLGDFGPAATDAEEVAREAEQNGFVRRAFIAWVEAATAYLLDQNIAEATKSLHHALKDKRGSSRGERVPRHIRLGDGLADLAALHHHVDHARQRKPEARAHQYQEILERGGLGLRFGHAIRYAGLLWYENQRVARIWLNKGKRICELLRQEGQEHHDLRYWLALAQLASGHADHARRGYEEAVAHCGGKGVAALAKLELDLFFRQDESHTGLMECRKILLDAMSQPHPSRGREAGDAGRRVTMGESGNS